MMEKKKIRIKKAQPEGSFMRYMLYVIYDLTIYNIFVFIADFMY